MIAAPPSPWATFSPATCMPDACFCEAIREGWIRQPANAWSSLAFVGVAAAVIATGLSDRRAARKPPAALPGDVGRSPFHGLAGWPALLAFALALIGLGSAFYHASLTFAGQFADLMGMYLVATLIVLYALGRRLRTRSVVAAYLALNAALAGLLWSVPQARRWAFAAVLLTGLAVERSVRRATSVPSPLATTSAFAATEAPRPDSRLLRRGVAILAVAFGIWVLDLTGLACAPGSPLQGHAVWHVLGAAASWCLYAYYRSERRPSAARSGAGGAA